ncbi:uncharacterized protein B0P05DRAFT_536652 [Gilbertella persicaria]|uniref:uncharacterized protein n=1 Tax=Gilbertella persicaria TaxID=101096 RepID=UPI002220D852|nr:uncharacterized protein B0P05DRAFT_536652 [Gilbertella persicaria]KAI8083239.1 hypothetical protein B0P05DRAFT_536652 [Gilbertella persicaria]
MATSENHLSLIPLPEKEIEDLLCLHHTISSVDLHSLFHTITAQIGYWLEQVHLSVFTLEQHVQQEEDYDMNQLNSINQAMIRMDPIITLLSGDVAEIMYEREQQMKITKIQSEWSSLYHFVTSVKSQVMAHQNLKQLSESIEQLLLDIDDVSLMMFEFQEKKHKSVVAEDLFSPGQPWAQSNNKDDQAMQEIDTAFDPLLNRMEQIYTRVSSTQQQLDPTLLRRFEKAKEKWENLQGERDDLRQEHKEDRWLTVFRRVADQVDVMIDGLDRSVVQCYSLIHQTRDWQQQALEFKSSKQQLLKSFNYHHTNVQPLPVDKEKFRSAEKSFEAKYKYYTPSIDRMLGMLGNGISARASRDNSTFQRHESMLQRWHHLKEAMDELRMRGLVEAERIILSATTSSNSSTTSTSYPSTANTSPSSLGSGWRQIRYRTPEPSSHDYAKSKYDEIRTRSATPNSAYHKLGQVSPRQTKYTQEYTQSSLRGSLSDSSSVDSTPRTRQTKTPRPTRQGSSTTYQEDFYDEDERHYGVDIMKPRRPPSADKKRTNSRSKTPNPPTINHKSPSLRSKSSMGDLLTHRTVSPSFSRRSVTPSLIPRPKTPKEEAPQPRPKSQMMRQQKPPLPPVPKHAVPRLTKKPSMMQVSVKASDCKYRPDPRDPLDAEVAHIVNASPIPIQCQKSDQPGKYYFGNELSISSMGGRKLYTCKLMTYGDRRGGQFKSNKVLIRVGGGWQDLEFFLLEHSSLMASDVVVRSFTPTKTVVAAGGGGWRN